MGKIYIPSSMINNSYRYNIQLSAGGGIINVYTHNNCVVNNPNFCDCYLIYPHLDYFVSPAYQCNVNTIQNGSFDSSSVTSDFWYRKDISDCLLLFLILFIFIIFIPYKIISRLFGRWLKV